MKLITRLLPLALCVFVGCSMTNSGGGGTDFPNSNTSQAALGVALAGNITTSDNWGDSTPKAQPMPDVAEGLNTVAPTPNAKSLSFNMSDTALGIVYAYYANTTNSFVETDTFVMLYDQTFRDTGKPTKHSDSCYGEKIFTGTGIDEHYSFIAANGDSFINNINHKPNRLAIHYSIKNGYGITTTADFKIEADTSDNDLNTKKSNRFLASRFARFNSAASAATDTYSSVAFSPYAATDSVIIDRAKTDSTLVRLRVVNNAGLGLRQSANVVYVAFGADSTKDYAAFLSNSLALSNGITVGSHLRGLHADSLFFAGDTALAGKSHRRSHHGLPRYP